MACMQQGHMMVEADAKVPPWSLEILRNGRTGVAWLVLSAIFLGCHPTSEAVVATRPEWRPLDADRATAEQLGREIVEKIGYEEIIACAQRAGWVTTTETASAQRSDGAMLAFDAGTAGRVFVKLYTKRAVTAGVAALADSPAPGPGDAVAIGILVVGLFLDGYMAYELVRSAEEVPVCMATGTPVATTPPLTMPPGLSPADQKLWRTCEQQHDTYKATEREAATYAPRMDPIQDRLEQNRASAQDRADFCSLLDERIRLVKRLRQERQKYIDDDCDKFDWFGIGKTADVRLARHLGELYKVDTHLKNLYATKKRFCQ